MVAKSDILVAWFFSMGAINEGLHGSLPECGDLLQGFFCPLKKAELSHHFVQGGFYEFRQYFLTCSPITPAVTNQSFPS